MPDAEKIGRRLAQARGPISTAEWARRLAIPEPDLIRIEAGELVPSLACLEQVRALTGLSLDWLITGQGPEDPADAGGPKRKFSDLSLAQLAASLLNDTSLPKHEREIIGDLIVAAVTDPQIRAAIILHYRFLNFTGPAGR